MFKLSNFAPKFFYLVSRRSCEGEGGHRRRKGSHLQQTAKKARQGQESRANGDVAEAEMVREEAEQELLSGSPIHTLVLRAQHDLFSAVLRALILYVHLIFYSYFSLNRYLKNNF